MGKEGWKEALQLEQFPRAARYDPEWMVQNEMGPSSLWLMEFLSDNMTLKPGMKVLDLGCGKAGSSIFLAREFGVQVWALDLWIDPGQNWERIKEAGQEDLIYPLQGEAHALPFAPHFFDAIVSADAYHYFGTCQLYLHYIIKFLRPGGQIGIVVPGLIKDMEEGPPPHLEPHWESEFYTFHTPAWWARLWSRSGLMQVEVADNMPRGWEVWLRWEQNALASGLIQREGDLELLQADGGEYLGFSRIIGRRKEG